MTAAISLEESEVVHVVVLNKIWCSISPRVAEQSAIFCKIPGLPPLEIAIPLWGLKEYVFVRVFDLRILARVDLFT